MSDDETQVSGIFRAAAPGTKPPTAAELAPDQPIIVPDPVNGDKQDTVCDPSDDAAIEAARRYSRKVAAARAKRRSG